MDISICKAGAIFIKEVMRMTNYREILRLDSIGLNKTEIAASCGCSRNTVVSALKRAAECGLSWPLPADMSDQQLARILYPSAAGKPELGFYDYSNTSRPIFSISLTSSFLSIAPSANACCIPGPNEIAVGPFPLYIAASSFGFQPERHHNLLLL